MENRKLIILFSLFLSLTVYGQALAYEVGTHAFLTSEILKFYNQNFENKIPEEFKDKIINGSIDEDDVPRWMNHFYDPVYNRGLTIDSATFSQADVAAVSAVNASMLNSKWLSSKEWAKNSGTQTSILYNPIMRTTIAGFLAVTNPETLRTTDYTWERAISDYIKGNKERAFRGLGHILHLIEDASVPDHTRNDPHPAFDSKDSLETGSPYEIWTGNFNLENPDTNLVIRLANKKPIILTDLNAYFDGMAIYSNNNFYSKDTVGISEYESPGVDYFGFDGPYNYGFKRDLEFGDFHLLAYKNPPDKYGWAVNNKDNLIFKEKIGILRVLPDYWSRLSVKAVQHGAGVIDLFFKEVEKAKSDSSFVKDEPKSMLAQAVDKVGNFFNRFLRAERDTSGLALVAEIPLNRVERDLTNNQQQTTNNNFGEIGSPSIGDDQDEDAAERVARQALTNDSQPTTNNLPVSAAPAGLSGIGQGEATFQQCKYNSGGTPILQKLLINEVAWMGTATGTAGANDEWLELKNISAGELDISGWQVLDKEEQIKVTFKNGTKLAAGGFFLLERTNDNSVPSTAADLVYAGALSNTDEGLRLYDKNCVLVDEVIANPDWPAGESAARKTMERGADLSWHTYSGNGENNIFGTPRKENSAPFSGGENPPAQQENLPPLKILISEVQITGGTGQSDNEFIELYNPGNVAVDLSALPLKLHIRNSSGTDNHKPLTFINTTIPAKGYFLIGPASGYLGLVSLDATYSVSSGNKLVNNGGVYISKSVTADTEVLDMIGWGTQPAGGYETAAFPENPAANQSIFRQSETDTDNNAADFALEALSQVTVQPSHIVISEFYPDRTGANQDFVELYNPNATNTPDMDISGWSLQVLSANATSTEKIAKKNFESGNKIPARGFFLVGIDNYPVTDMNWASGGLNSTNGATIFLVSGTTTISDFEDPRIVDQIAYGAGSGLIAPETQATPLPAVGQSLERKALQSGNCVSAQGAGEFLGNGCDTDNNASDFEVRPAPKPQGRNNLLEPREAPPVPENFIAEYDAPTLKITLNWNGATSTKYVFSYSTTSPAALKRLAEVTATTTYFFKTDEVGVDYYFAIAAQDNESLTSAIATSTLNIPPLLTNFYFYKDARSTTSKKYLFDFYYDSYPFIPDVYNKGTGRILVFYLNKEAPTELELNTANNFQPENLSNVLDVVYERCAGSNSPSFSLVLPGSCGIGGGVENQTLKTEFLEDLHLLVELATTTDGISFANQDFITVGMYSFYDSGGGSQRYRLAALDRNKYYFQNSAPVHQAPIFNGDPELNFNENRSELKVSWSAASDPDTLDNLLTYEINYSTTTELAEFGWQNNGSPAVSKRQVSPGDSFLIGVRAKDDFGNYSNILTAEWSYPETTFYIEQNQTNSWSWTFGTRNPNGGLDTAGLQSIQPEEDLEFNTVVLRLRQEVISDAADLQLLVYPDLDGLPDFDELIGEANLKDIFNPDPNLDIVFTFDESIPLTGGDIYWLVLRVKKYGDSRGYFRNQWQNAINTGTNLYSAGQAGMGNSGVCDSWCSFYIPSPDATADWYMKIGLTEY